MSIHNIKEIIRLSPEVLGLIKQAKIEQEFPTDCKDSVLASALEIEYLTKVAKEYVDETKIQHINKAVELYELEDVLATHSDTMVKSASVYEVDNIKSSVEQAELMFDGDPTNDIEKKAHQAEQLWDNYAEHINSEDVKIYAGISQLDKKAAVDALQSRYHVTSDEKFTKIASIIEQSNEHLFTVEDNRSIARAVIGIEKSAEIYCNKGFNFYKEAFVSKANAADVLTVDLNGSIYSVSDVSNVSMEKIATYVGASIMEGVDMTNASEVKSAIDSLSDESRNAFGTLLGDNIG